MTGGMQIRDAHFPGRAPIDAYGNGGFRFAEMSHRGSLLCLPSGIYGWRADDPAVLSEADFERPIAEAEEIEILLIGTGKGLRPLSAELRKVLKDAGMAVETMATGAAVRTFNVLLAEERAVAAAIIAVD
ncbi:Mth938-like domain-containing protein [Chelativorans sp. YIM 93263]|uniref:Mth938-like domain-containing protein n=1 Tax=Chelativorans sp. YIM 93263 TaxID=2906648 RepID=UPI002378B010|nr:MTH938/NDUFAF3 family protein [Chelativorans sp. YIM 93263]